MGRIISLDLVARFFRMQPRKLLATFATRTHYWFTVSLPYTRTSRSFSAELLSRWPQTTVGRSCSSTDARLCIFLCWTQRGSSLPSWSVAQPSGVSATLPSFISFANLFRSLIMELNRIGPNTDPWQTSIVTFFAAVLCMTDHNPLGQVVHLVFDPPHCPFI